MASLTVAVNCTLDSLDQKHTVEYRFIKHVLVLAVQCHLLVHCSPGSLGLRTLLNDLLWEPALFIVDV